MGPVGAPVAAGVAGAVARDWERGASWYSKMPTQQRDEHKQSENETGNWWSSRLLLLYTVVSEVDMLDAVDWEEDVRDGVEGGHHCEQAEQHKPEDERDRVREQELRTRRRNTTHHRSSVHHVLVRCTVLVCRGEKS